MAKYTYVLSIDDSILERGDEDADAIFDTEEEAADAGFRALGEMRYGDEILNLSNPGDNPYDEDYYDEIDVGVIELDD